MNPMCAKRTVAISIAILMSVLSVSASQCEISCSLSGRHSSTASTTSFSAFRSRGTHSHFSHSHCNHVAKADQTSSGRFESTSNCSNTSCLGTVALSSPAKIQDGAGMDRRPLALCSVLSLPVGMYRSPLPKLRWDASRHRAVLPSTLPTNLRI